jgi:eukaryotic-like serine/threonine-protein kinase
VLSQSFDSLALAAAGEAALPTHTLPAGARVGEYQVTGLVGQGGMGVVYSGVHPLLGRKVAIKILNRQVAHPEAAARFLQEARAASRLRHQNIVDVFAFGQMPDGHYYQVMELLEGESLRAHLHRDGPLTLAQARTVIIGVLSGLGAAHRPGIIHRDIKPDNIFLCAPLATLAASDVKILDFGLAKQDSGETSVKTRTGVTMGTPAYMSPEQCRALPDIDARADLYAAGIVLFEMLAGHPPFQSDSAFDVMTMQINVVSPRLGHVTGRPEPMENVISHALEKRPAARFDTAEEMLAAIDKALPAGALAEYASGGPMRPPRRAASDLANRPTLVAPSGAATPAGATADAAFSTNQGGRFRGLPGVGILVAVLGFGALGAAVAWRGGHARKSAAPTAIVPAAPVAPTPAAPAAPMPAAAAPRPAIEAANGSEATPGPAIQRGGAKQPAATRARPHRSAAAGTGPAGGAKKRAPETDLDSPLNPYAR